MSDDKPDALLTEFDAFIKPDLERLKQQSETANKHQSASIDVDKQIPGKTDPDLEEDFAAIEQSEMHERLTGRLEELKKRRAARPTETKPKKKKRSPSPKKTLTEPNRAESSGTDDEEQDDWRNIRKR